MALHILVLERYRSLTTTKSFLETLLQEVSEEVNEAAHSERRALVEAVQCAADVGEWLRRLWDHVAGKTLHTVTRAP